MGMYGHATFGVGISLDKLEPKIEDKNKLEEFLYELEDGKEIKYIWDADGNGYILYIFTEDDSHEGVEGAPLVELNIESADKGSYAIRNLIRERFNVDFPRKEFSIIGGTFYR